MKLTAALFACELPVDGGTAAIDAAAPGMDFAAQCCQVRNPVSSQTVAAGQAHFDFGLVEPTALFGCVVDREPLPQQATQFPAMPLDQRLAAVGIKVMRTRWMVRASA
jgi:hypothetical protein